MSDEILKVTDLSIKYRMVTHPIITLRDKFINSLKDPFSLIRPHRYNVILENLNLTLNRGDIVALLGVNGAGKSSFCRFAAGICKSNDGEIKLNGNCKAIFNTEVGIIPELSGRENAIVLATMMHPEASKKEIIEIVDEAMEFSELGEYGDVAFQYYSRGMKARLYLSLISGSPADLLILDEVFEGADLFFNKKISERVSNMINQSGAVIFVSHSIGQIQQVCNRCIVFNNKGVAFDGSIEEGREYYISHCDPSSKSN